MCIDNPREGFGELFDTHPTVESRVAALVKFAGGHDPGPMALPRWNEAGANDPAAAEPRGPAPENGPWGSLSKNGSKAVSPAELGGGSGPWGPHSGG
jgi:heat shock protein HtpX